MLKDNAQIHAVLSKLSLVIDKEGLEIILNFIYELNFGKSTNTILAYLYDIYIGLKYFYMKHGIYNPEKLYALNSSHFRAFIAEQKAKGVSATTQQRFLSSWKALFRRYNLASLDNFKSPKSLRRYPKPVSDETIEKILQMDETEFTSLRNKALWVLMYTSGMRISEALSLKFGDISNKIITIRGKGAKQRMIPLTQAALNVILKYAQLRNNLKIQTNLLFTNLANKPITQQAASHAFKRWKLEAGAMERCTLHSLRHAFASHILKNGCPLPVIQKTLGHRNLSTTTQYLKIEDKYLENEFMKRIAPKSS